MTDSAEWPRVLGCLNVYKESRPNGFKNKLEFQNIAGAETLPPPFSMVQQIRWVQLVNTLHLQVLFE